MPEPTQHKQTEFNSSQATLIRIDKLITECHSLRRGLIPVNVFGQPLTKNNPTDLFLDSLFDFFVEVSAKMTPSEINTSDKYTKEVTSKKESYGNNLCMPTVERGNPRRELRNHLFFDGWDELHDIGDKYFIFLMKSADNHGMLLTTKQTGEDAATQ